MGVFSLISLVIIIPFAGAFINAFFGRQMMLDRGSRAPGVLASIISGLTFTVVLVIFLALLQNPEEAVIVPFFTWFDIPVGPLHTLTVEWAHRVDTLSVVMMLVVTGIGTLIHIFAVEYMHGDIDEQANKRGYSEAEATRFKQVRYPRFFTYLNLFLGSMLILVTGDNYLMLFVGWEAVGVCSFLLIGFWFDDIVNGISNANAAKKAFIVNRVGDFGMLLAIFLTFWSFGSLQFDTVFARAECMREQSQEYCLARSAEELAPATGEETHQEEATRLAPGLASALAAEEGGEGEGGHSEEVGYYATPIALGITAVPLTAAVTAITLLFLLGATGKSAQIPLFVWLPDAMAGPTPVSALIHAATMVTAGIYMITRSNVLYHMAPLSADTVAIIGGLTGLVAATMAVAQYDIKRVLAFSTISQLGFMIAAVGVGGYLAGIFHLATHAFFKALLFLGSGSVIHGMEHGHHHAAHHGHDDHGHDAHGHDHGEHHDAHAHEEAHQHDEHAFDPQDMRLMGGLAKKMPITTAVYVIGALALAGIPPLAGFWSKDEILLDARNENMLVYILLSLGAVFTAFYMGRQVFMVFYGQPRSEAAANASESSPVMTVPLIILAALSVLGGLMNLPFKGFHQLGYWLEHSVQYLHIPTFDPTIPLIATTAAVLAIGLSYLMYGRDPLQADETDPLETRGGAAFTFLQRRWYWDEVYKAIFVTPFVWLGGVLANAVDWNFWHDFFHDTLIGGGFRGLAKVLSKPVDGGLIDGAVNGLAKSVSNFSGNLRRIETGYVRNYALVVLLGVLSLLVYIAARLFL